jgi:ABC-type iron transport system FetAB permease component
MIDFLGYFLAGIRFLINNFPILCLIVGVILLSVNTYNMEVDKNKAENSKLYTDLNISSLAFFGIFVFDHFLTPYLEKRFF